MESYLYFHNISGIIRNIFLLIAIISGILFISIELFLFILLKTKSKLFYIGYIILDLGISVFLTTKNPYSGFLLVLLFSTIKNVLRIVLVEELYMPKEFDRYCKMYGITVRDFKKERKVTKKKEVVVIPAEPVKKQAATKKKTTTKKRTQKEATI